MTEQELKFTTSELAILSDFMRSLPGRNGLIPEGGGYFDGSFTLKGYDEFPPHRIYYDYEFESWVLALTGKENDND